MNSNSPAESVVIDAFTDGLPRHEIEALMFPVTNGINSIGMSGLGEPSTVATAGAIGNAVANAIGVRIRSLPITPDKVLAALKGMS